METDILAGELDDLLLTHSEDDLIDAYCLGKLNKEEQQGYTEYFLISEDRRRRHAFSVALMEYARSQTTETSPGSSRRPETGRAFFVLSWKQVAALATAACVLLTTLAALEFLQMRREAQLAAELRAKIVQLQEAPDSGPGRDSRLKETSPIPDDEQSRIAPLLAVDFSSSTRSLSAVPLRIPAGAQFVRIKVTLPSPGSFHYRELFVALDGRKLWVRDLPASTPSQYTTKVPASALPPGVCHFKIEGASSEGNREFDQVVRVEK